MLKRMIFKSKIHGATVTHSNLNHVGSVKAAEDPAHVPERKSGASTTLRQGLPRDMHYEISNHKLGVRC